MQVKIEKGRGYQPGDVRAFRDDYSKAAIGRIIMDASFSPILRVAYQVQAARRGPAHRPRQARDDDRDQTAPSVPKTPFVKPSASSRISSPCSARSIRTPAPTLLLPRKTKTFRRRSIRSCSVRSTISSSRFVPPTASSREHLLHRRSDPAHGKRASQDAEPRPQVPERNQGSARRPRPHARLPSRKLAARPGTLMDRKGVVAVR